MADNQEEKQDETAETARDTNSPENGSGTGLAAPMRRLTGQWAPGVSGNPKGRPRALPALREALRKEGLESVRVLAHLRDHAKQESVRLKASTELLDRGFGKPGTMEPTPEDTEDNRAALDDVKAILDA